MSSTGSTAVNPPDRDTPVGNADQHGVDRDQDRFDRDRDSVVAREKERYGGMKMGAGFFGWLTATGTTVILLALITAIAAGIGSSYNLTSQQACDNAQKIGIGGGIVFAVVLFLAYFCGGYVAGRMSRFNGLKQGLAVWLWAIVITIVVAVLGAIAGNKFNVLSQMSFPQMPASASDLTVGGIIGILALLIIALAGAILGGIAGMRYHRNVDKAGLDPHHR